MAIVVTISIVVLILTYKFIIPSLWTFRNNQMNVYDSVLMDKIDALTKEIQDLKSKDIKTSL